MTAHTATVAPRLGAPAVDRSALPLMFRGGVIATVALLPVAAIIGFATRGVAGGLGAASGVAVSAAIFLLGYLGMRWVLEHLHPNASLAGALGMYFLQISLMFPALLLLTNVRALDGRAVALGALVSALVWLMGQLWGFMRARTPMFDVQLPGERR